MRLLDHHIAVGIAHREGNHPLAILRRGDIDRRTALDRVVVHRHLLDEEPVGSPDRRRYGYPVGQDQVDVAVDAAVDVLLGRSGQHVVLESVADHYEQAVLGAELHAAGDFEREGRETAAVLADMIAVDEDVGHGLHAVEAQEEPLRRPVGRNVEPAHVVARRALVLRVAGQRIEVPRMGQGDIARVVSAVFAAEIESPVVVETVDLPRGGLRHEGRQHTDQKQITFHNPPIVLVRTAHPDRLRPRRSGTRPRAKIRISEGRSKHRLDYAEREYLRRQPKIRISEGRSKRQAIKTASCRAVTIPCCNIAALSAARAEASARGGPPLWACSADFDPQLRQQPILTHPRDDGTEFQILILKLPIAGCFCTRLAHFAEDKPPLR